MDRNILLTLLLIVVSHFAFAQSCPVVPLPLQAKAGTGAFSLSSRTPVVITDPELASHAYFLQTEILKRTGIPLAIQKASHLPAIILRKTASGDNGSEAYALEVNPAAVRITAAGDRGLFYGIISLLQLMSSGKEVHKQVEIKSWTIHDEPQFGWRGLMLDESRHFFGKAEVKRMLDWMAFYKLNRFHWHLTDAPGWRIEIKNYPRLTLTGGIGNFSDSLAPATYYTQEEIKEIVRYASERYITIIPEIDMPGHGSAANRAYPEFSGGGSAKHPEFTFNPGKEGTYEYLTSILKETNVLFPSQMVHLGGDEVSFGNEKWNTDPAVQLLMKDHQLKDLSAVEQYFNRRMADSLFSLDNKVLFWDEAADNDLPADKTIICWWRHDKPDQLKKAIQRGYATVLCPRLPFYFDFIQDSTQRVGRRWQGAFVDLKRLYQFSLSDLPITNGQYKQVLGIQGAIWTEHISTRPRLQYMLFPRMAALAENAWTTPGRRNYDDFLKRLEPQFELYRKDGIYFYNPLKPLSTPEPLAAEDL